MTKKCIIITTVNPPSSQVLFYSLLPDWTVIIVSDKKTDDFLFEKINVLYLNLIDQKALFPEYFNHVPYNSYTRKMFGYLYAVKNNFDLIYDTDDDNQYINDINLYNKFNNINCCTDYGLTNIYKIYTKTNIWPRGIPPHNLCINKVPNLEEHDGQQLEISVIQGLVNNDPDIDAYCRLNICKSEFFFDDISLSIKLNKGAVCPFNSQNTFWINKTDFDLLYLPVTVNFRYTDILRGIVAQFILWKRNKTVIFTAPTAIQLRNKHDLYADFKDEIQMYSTVETVVNELCKGEFNDLVDVYKILYKLEIVDEAELEAVRLWTNFFI